MILPCACETVRLHASVTSVFELALFERLGYDEPTGGLLFGRVCSETEIVIEYAIPHLLKVAKAQMFGIGYVHGIRDAARDAAWHLRGLVPVGQWLAYVQGPPLKEHLIADFALHRKLDPQGDPLVLLSATFSEAKVPDVLCYSARLLLERQILRPISTLIAGRA